MKSLKKITALVLVLALGVVAPLGAPVASASNALLEEVLTLLGNALPAGTPWQVEIALNVPIREARLANPQGIDRETHRHLMRNLGEIQVRGNAILSSNLSEGQIVVNIQIIADLIRDSADVLGLCEHGSLSINQVLDQNALHVAAWVAGFTRCRPTGPTEPSPGPTLPENGGGTGTLPERCPCGCQDEDVAGPCTCGEDCDCDCNVTDPPPGTCNCALPPDECECAAEAPGTGCDCDYEEEAPGGPPCDCDEETPPAANGSSSGSQTPPVAPPADDDCDEETPPVAPSSGGQAPPPAAPSPSTPAAPAAPASPSTPAAPAAPASPSTPAAPAPGAKPPIRDTGVNASTGIVAMLALTGLAGGAGLIAKKKD